MPTYLYITDGSYHIDLTVVQLATCPKYHHHVELGNVYYDDTDEPVTVEELVDWIEEFA